MNPTSSEQIICAWVPKLPILEVKGPASTKPAIKSDVELYSLFRQHPLRGWMRFTSVALPWNEALTTWGEVTPEGIQIRPISQ